MDYLTPAQCRAARALLNWSQPDLAERCGMHVQTISAFESETGTPTRRTLTKITDTLEMAGVELGANEGVSKKVNPITIYKGTDGFRAFMDDVYETAKKYGGEICLHNSRPKIWYDFLGEDWYEKHNERMIALGDKIDTKITLEPGNTFVISGFAQHRWFKSSPWKGKIFYAYGPKLGFLEVFDDNVQVTVLNKPEYADSFRELFNIAWEHASMEIPQQERV